MELPDGEHTFGSVSQPTEAEEDVVETVVVDVAVAEFDGNKVGVAIVDDDDGVDFDDVAIDEITGVAEAVATGAAAVSVAIIDDDDDVDFDDDVAIDEVTGVAETVATGVAAGING